MSEPFDESIRALLAEWLRLEDPTDRTRFREAFNGLLARVEQRHVAYRNVLRRGTEYLPTPLVGHVLSQMRDARPEAFSALHIIGQDVAGPRPEEASRVQRTLWLPRYDPEVPASGGRAGSRARQGEAGEMESLGPWAPQYGGDPDVLIARYVASCTLGIAVSFGPRKLLLDFVSAKARAGWGPLIDQAFRMNGGPLMQTFVEQVRSRAAKVDLRGLGYPQPVGVSSQDCERLADWTRRTPFRILGIDLGGTSVKWQPFDVGGGSDRGASVRTSGELTALKWRVLEERPGFKSDRVGVLMATIRDGYGAQTGVDAVGISLAAPVRDGVPVGPSKVFEKLAGHLGIAGTNPLHIHRLDLAKWVREVFENPEVPVVVLNDGEADIQDTAPSGSGAGGLSVLLKEGSGVAFAVYEDGKPLNLLAETSKAILNLRCAVGQGEDPEHAAERDPQRRYPAGTVGAYCSKRGFGTLLGPAPQGVEETPSEAGDWDDELSRATGRLLANLLAESTGDDERGAGGARAARPIDGRLRGLWETLSAQHGSAIRALYEDVARVHWRRGRLHLEERLRRLSDADPSAQDGRLGREAEALAEHLKQLASHRPWQQGGKGGPRAVTEQEKGAVACAWVLGRWLADAIALVWEVYGAREVRLAGGPLSAKTGLFIARSAAVALEEVYGFDLEEDTIPGLGERPTLEPVPVAAHRIREAKRLRLVYPLEEGTQGGPRGAAKAALNAYLAGLKRDQLRACRDLVADAGPPAGGGGNEPFRAADVWSEGEAGWRTRKQRGPWLVTDKEVEAMLEAQSSVLGLTRVQEGQFKKW